MNKNSNKRNDLINLLSGVVFIILLNYVGSFLFHRFDLTSEKRFTLSDVTKKTASEIDDVVFVRIYLEGEFPAGFKRLRDATHELLDELRAITPGKNIEYEFVNPSASADMKERNAIYKQLSEQGLQPTNLEVKDDNGTSQQIIWPAAVVSYKGRSTPWQLLTGQMGFSSDEVLNHSVQNLEYEFCNCMRRLNTGLKRRVGFIEGHGELDSLDVADVVESLNEYYSCERVTINEKLKALDNYSAIVIAKPDSMFSEKDKFIIDQYIMNGGNVLWLIDPVLTSVDSLRYHSYTMAVPFKTNLEDQLFKYGVRINTNLLLDLQSAMIPINKALLGQPPNFKPEPWLFYPLIQSRSEHPIVKNLDLIKFEFASTLDTIQVQGIKKTVLLAGSRYSKPINAPARVDLRMVNIRPDERQFNKPFQPVAVLLEGSFESLYKNRLAAQIAGNKEIGFKESGKPAKMIVVSDGDVIRNLVFRSAKKVYPLGYDDFMKQTFANKLFVLNCLNYLCDDSGLLSVRSRDIKLRLLDKKKIRAQRVKWQLVNTLVPISLIVLFGMILFYLRKRRYATNTTKVN